MSSSESSADSDKEINLIFSSSFTHVTEKIIKCLFKSLFFSAVISSFMNCESHYLNIKYVC